MVPTAGGALVTVGGRARRLRWYPCSPGLALSLLPPDPVLCSLLHFPVSTLDQRPPPDTGFIRDAWTPCFSDSLPGRLRMRRVTERVAGIPLTSDLSPSF